MSLREVLAELPKLTVSGRHLLVRCALELDYPALSPEDQSVVDTRLAEHRRNPKSSVQLDEMKARLRGLC
jgi:hypothetical protein